MIKQDRKCPACKRTIPNRLEKVLAGVLVVFGTFGLAITGTILYMLAVGGL